jgi:putative SOS response-associated peptidase YedK
MCANYLPVTAQDRLLQFFGIDRPREEVPPEVYPGGLAPFVIRDADRVELARDVRVGRFGLLPLWAKDMAFGRRTYNARSETVDEKPSFRDAWRAGRRCIVPAEVVFEPNWETGRAVRHAITRRDARPMGIAGLWGWWLAADGQRWLSFTMLTVNADGHEVFGRMHRPGEEKRMVAILDERDYDTWLEAPVETVRALLKPWPAERLEARADPRPNPSSTGTSAARSPPLRARAKPKEGSADQPSKDDRHAKSAAHEPHNSADGSSDSPLKRPPARGKPARGDDDTLPLFD